MGITDEERTSSLRNSVRDAIASSMMTTLTTAFFTAFAVALGADNIYIGMLSSIPLSVWTIAQMPAAKLVERMPRRKEITIAASLLARLMLIPIASIPFFFLDAPLPVLLFFVSASSFFTAFASPAWSSWMGDLVPNSIRGKYFARRLRLSTLFSVGSLVFAGAVFCLFPENGLTGFQIVFAAAVACGIVSLFFLRMMHEPKFLKKGEMAPEKDETTSLRKHRRMKKFLIIFMVWQVGVTLSAPFYVVKILTQLDAGYVWVSIQAILMSLSMASIQKLWGRSFDMFGGKLLLSICALGASVYPLAWIFVTAPIQMVPIEILGGIAWGGFNLAYFNYLLEVSPSGSRHTFSAFFNIVYGAAGVAGPLIGGLLAEYFAERALLSLTGLNAVFLISWMLRLLGAVLFIKFLEEVPMRPRITASFVFGEMAKYGHKKAVSRVFIRGRIGVKTMAARARGRRLRPNRRAPKA